MSIENVSKFNHAKVFLTELPAANLRSFSLN